jgi:hypothetical protein
MYRDSRICTGITEFVKVPKNIYKDSSICTGIPQYVQGFQDIYRDPREFVQVFQIM